MKVPHWLDSLGSSLKSQFTTWFIGLLIAILSLFSSQLTESIKFGLNRADSRTHQYEELATEISQYIFNSELSVEFIEKDWTTKASLTALINDYNQSITTLRKKEFVYSAWVQKYWGKKQLVQYESFMTSVRAFDNGIHSLNDEFESVIITGSKQKVDKNRSMETLKVLKPEIEAVRENGKLILISLE